MPPDPNRPLKVLIVGGYGTFGGRLVQLLESEARFTLQIAGRSLRKASAYCAARAQARARLIPVAFDRDGDLQQQISLHQPDIVVDASGPFQAYGPRPYHLIEACIAGRVSYLDLADGSAFVSGVKSFNSRAIEAGVFVLSGVSSFPVLTAAVVRHLSKDFTHVTAIRGGIAPSPYAGVGVNVIRAIASYAGQPISVRKDGAATTAYPFAESLRYLIAPPGKVPLRWLRFSLVDVPDLRVLSELWPDARDIWMGAAPVPPLLHRLLTLCAWLVRIRLLPSLSPLAPLMAAIINRLRWGEDRGGMFVEVRGVNERAQSVTRSWHLIAEGADGPLIPSMAAEAVLRDLLNDHVPGPGSRAAVRDLQLADYEKLFQGRQVFTGVRMHLPAADAPLYARILGPAWHTLPTEIRRMHSIATATRVRGRSSVERGPGRLARIIARLFGFPKAGNGVEVSVEFDTTRGVETWTRDFAGTRFSSTQAEGHGRNTGLLCENFGPFRFAMALVASPNRLDLVLRGWSVFGLSLPLRFGPTSNSFESIEQGRFRFHVEIAHPLTGLIVRYRGWLSSESES